MPIYEYTCNKCHDNFALLQSVEAAGKGTKCPRCGSTEVKKLISPFSCSLSPDSGSSAGGSPGFSGGG